MHYSQRGSTYRGAGLSFIRWSRHRAACFRSLHQAVRIASLAINVISSLENKAKSVFATKRTFVHVGLELAADCTQSSECNEQQLIAEVALTKRHEETPQAQVIAFT